MTAANEDAGQRVDEGKPAFPLLVVAPLAGAAVGAICALFRLVLDMGDRWRPAAIEALRPFGWLGAPLVMLAVAAAAALAAFLVRRFARDAAGSGIPHVESVLSGALAPSPPRLIAVKFLGGVIAIGSGLALGREGPSVQMGATAAFQLGRIFRLSADDCRVLLAAGAGAGLATAFNAPIAGAIFVIEELVRRFETRIAIAALGASAAAITVARAILGSAIGRPLPSIPDGGDATMLSFAVFGAVAGLAAIVYNRTLLGALALSDRLAAYPVELRAAAIGAGVGLVAWFSPALVGGGDPLTERALLGAEALAVLPALLLIRLLLSTASYAAGTPGGLFAPMLTLGAQLGLLFGLLADRLLPGLGLDPRAFALVGMAAFFTGVVRAPLTGIALVLEMTGSATLLLPILAACFTAMLVPTRLGDPPIYDSLKQRTLRDAAKR